MDPPPERPSGICQYLGSLRSAADLPPGPRAKEHVPSESTAGDAGGTPTRDPAGSCRVRRSRTPLTWFVGAVPGQIYFSRDAAPIDTSLYFTRGAQPRAGRAAGAGSGCERGWTAETAV